MIWIPIASGICIFHLQTLHFIYLRVRVVGRKKEEKKSLCLRARLFLLALVLKWRVHGVHGMPAACRGTGAGGVVNAEARGKEGR
jgi:hypothetical protein